MTATTLVSAAANLLFGYRATWTTGQLPFFSSFPSSLTPVPAVRKDQRYPDWDDYPTITLHDSVESLLSTLYAFNVTDPNPRTNVPSGALALGDADRPAALDQAGAFLGLDLTRPHKYMLVRASRLDHTLTHPFLDNPGQSDRSAYLTPDALRMIDQLPRPAEQGGVPVANARVSTDDAVAYLNGINRLGTHFVGRASMGDLLFQVFAYDGERFDLLKTRFVTEATAQPDGSLAVAGLTAASWSYWTSLHEGDFGHAAAHGQLKCLSGDPALAAAIAAGSWSTPYMPKGSASIFAYARNYSLTDDLTQVVPISLTLPPVSALFSDHLVVARWERIVKGGLLQKWGDAIQVPVSPPVAHDWAALFPDSAESWTSGIVTPTIDIYQERVDLGHVKLVGADVVGKSFPLKSFHCFSQILQADAAAGGAAIALPGDSVTLVAQIIDTSRAARTPALTMSAKALDGLTVVCQEMYGALVFQANAAGGTRRKVALDAVLFENGPLDPACQRSTVRISGVLADKPAPALVNGLKESIELSLVAAESLLHARGTNGETIRSLQKEYLRWLAGIIPSDTTDLDLAQARMRALYLADQVATFGADVIYVPYLNYEAYRNYVGNMIRQAENLTGTIANYQARITTTVNSYKVMNSIADVNQNIKAIGGVLTDYFKALAAGQSSMNTYYEQMLASLSEEQTQTLAEVKTLSQRLKAQQAVISHVGDPMGIIEKFQNDYADYADKQVTQFIFSAVSGLFSLGMSLAALPAGVNGGVLSALTAIQDIFEKVQAILETLALLEAAQAAMDSIGDLNQLSSTISTASDLGNLQMPSQLDFQTLAENVRAALASVPSDDSNLNQDKADLIAAVNTLSDIGAALLTARAKASRTTMEIINQQRLKITNARQMADMSALAAKLHLDDVARPPDIAGIDLIGVSGALQYQLKQVLSVLARTLGIQDGAVQFEYFGDPVPITAFTLQNLLAVVSQQDRNALDGVERLNPPPQDVDEPITFVIRDVQARRLTGGNSFRFSIPLNAPQFSTYDMVRIRRVVPRIVGISGSTKGKYEIALACSARPFFDRDYARQTHTFTSNRRNFGPYVYSVSANKPEFGAGTGAFSSRVTHLTPFADWEITLPPDRANNQGLDIDLLVDIEIDFHVTAHYDDPAFALARSGSVRRLRLLSTPTDAPMDSPMASSPMVSARMATASSPVHGRAAAMPTVTLDSLRNQMHQNQEVLKGWDAVFTTLAGPVNAFLFQQFQDITKGRNVMDVSALYCENVVPVEIDDDIVIHITNVTKLNFKLSNPLVQFIPGNDSVTVTQNILAGSVASGTMTVAKKGFVANACKLPDAPVPFTVDPAAGTLTCVAGPLFHNGMQVTLSTNGTLPAPLKPDTTYWITGWSGVSGRTTLKLATGSTGTPIALTDAGTGTHTINAKVRWNEADVVDLSKKPYVKGSVALEQLQGLVEPPAGQGTKADTRTVLLDFPTGVFLLSRFTLKPANWSSSHHATAISDALANYFASNQIKYQVNTINLRNLASDPELTPSLFLLQASTTKAGNNVLQFYISTTGGKQNSRATLLDEPIAYDPVSPVPGISDFPVSLMISSKLAFQHIFVNNFNQGSPNLQAMAVAPEEGFKTYSAKITHGFATAVVPFKSSYEVRGGGHVQYRISPSSNQLSWDLSGMEFKCSKDGGYQLKYENGDSAVPYGGTRINFQYCQVLPAQNGVVIPFGPWVDASTTAYVKMEGSYPLTIRGEGKEQRVTFTTTEPEISFTRSSTLKPTGSCECNDNDVQIALLNALGETVPKTLKESMEKIDFRSISVLALESLLFPAEQLINMRNVSVPGNLLVVGSFLNAVRKKAPTYTVTISAASGAKGQFGEFVFENGVGTSSATIAGLPRRFSFTYGPIESVLGNMVTYSVDIEAGTVTPPSMLLVVMQPDPEGNPAKVVLLPPGYGPAA